MDKNNEMQAGQAFEGIDKIQKISINKLLSDDRNANRGTDKGKEVIKASIERYGIGRGVLVDKNMKLIAGNHAVAEMKAQGYENVIVVPTDGKTLVVTQRTDILKDSAAGHGLAIADNQATKENLLFDVDLMNELEVEFDLGLEDLHIDLNNETRDGAEQMEEYGEGSEDGEDYHDNGTFEDSDRAKNNVFPVMAALTKAERLRFDELKKRMGLHTDTETVVEMVKILSNR